MARTLKKKELRGTRLAANYGGWIYCENCGQTIGYLCYVTYQSFRMNYTCKCGNCGSMYLTFNEKDTLETAKEELITIKNRLCCPSDNQPLITILFKKLERCHAEIVCETCNKKYIAEQN